LLRCLEQLFVSDWALASKNGCAEETEQILMRTAQDEDQKDVI